MNFKNFLTLKTDCRGFTLVEAIVGTAVFLTIALASYNAYVSLFKLVDLSQYRVLATALANEQFEIARNLPYSDVGVQGSIPPGKIPHIQTLTRGGTPFTVTATVRNVDLLFDGTIGGTPNDLSPADNKKVQITVSCDGCRGMQPITLVGQVAPKNLETASANGALFIRVFDANGQPLQNVSVNVENIATTTTTIEINDVTDANGLLQLVDVPPDVNAYRITVTKSGYSTDRTYPPDTSNPIPPKPDATVLVQQVTQVSFAIDRISTVHISSVTPTCSVIPSFDFSLTSGKENGPGMPKYGSNHATDGSGTLTLSGLEWDIYTFAAIDTAYDLIGINPLNPFTVNPDTDMQLQLIVAPKDPQSLLVTVKDSATQLPLSDVTVQLTGVGGYDETFETGRGYINQTNWVGGSGQSTFTDATRYFADDTNVDVATSTGQVMLRNIFGAYNPAGWLESSTFDTGSDSNFYSLIWSPTDQPAETGAESVRMQFATAASTSPTGPWNFVGPDGTAATYYTSSNSSLSAIHADHQYARYRLYLATADPAFTPNVSDVSFTYTSDCVPPGQVIFADLLDNETYTLTVSKSGYATYTVDIPITDAWSEHQVLLAP
ncbi:MAG: carboxypeptidase-like regulatory domain-containing protein [Patescibacteria group bacterium]